MSHLMPTDIVTDVETVLKGAARGKGDHPYFLTAFQILDRLPAAVCNRLVAERTVGGEGTGIAYSATSVVAQAAMKVPGVVIDYIDTAGLTIRVGDTTVSPGFEVCAIFRVP